VSASGHLYFRVMDFYVRVMGLRGHQDTKNRFDNIARLALNAIALGFEFVNSYGSAGQHCIPNESFWKWKMYDVNPLLYRCT
jgi:hypothetical protein